MLLGIAGLTPGLPVLTSKRMKSLGSPRTGSGSDREFFNRLQPSQLTRQFDQRNMLALSLLLALQ
ncbi:Hypothetical protein CAP_2927 [Chondromyces apiculatus DSM 436]|uniref:Uncharacterized protein n=1 Tax=Chondromyces apiculatus DSM 436 TaxID=1192034 RepID=A0A017T9P1_9BACT|nr:Hypothetical protein CAP_2927 [Chondromyces apiculatus DSM 436]